jgi:hypothetical protein
MNILGPSLFSMVFIAIGAGILYYARKLAAKAHSSLSWPSVEGAIAHSAVLLRTRPGADSSNVPTYSPDVAYRYKVAGRDYSSATITLMDYSSGAGRAQDIVARYPDGAAVSVYYNPADPAESVLERGPTRGIAILRLIGWVFAAAGLFFLYMSVTGRVHTGS